MARKLPEIWGVTEVSRELGVAHSNLSRVPGLPEPDQVIAAGRLWRADVIRKFARERRERSHWTKKGDEEPKEDPIAA